LTKLDGKLEEKATPSRRDYAWPLTVGTSWEYTYTRERLFDRQTEELITAAVVEREETVTVPAGTFQTFKLVYRNTRTQVVGGEWWYAPAVKSYVRQRFYVSAQNQGASGSVSCDIVVNDEVKTTATSTGAYVVAECSEADQP
jgi:hypothetical protein